MDNKIAALKRQVDRAELMASLKQDPALKAEIQSILQQVDSQHMTAEQATEEVLQALSNQPVQL